MVALCVTNVVFITVRFIGALWRQWFSLASNEDISYREHGEMSNSTRLG